MKNQQEQNTFLIQQLAWFSSTPASFLLGFRHKGQRIFTYPLTAQRKHHEAAKFAQRKVENKDKTLKSASTDGVTVLETCYHRDGARVILDCFCLIRHSYVGVSEFQECSHRRTCAWQIWKSWQHFEYWEDGQRIFGARSRKTNGKTKSGRGGEFKRSESKRERSSKRVSGRELGLDPQHPTDTWVQYPQKDPSYQSCSLTFGQSPSALYALTGPISSHQSSCLSLLKIHALVWVNITLTHRSPVKAESHLHFRLCWYPIICMVPGTWGHPFRPHVEWMMELFRTPS